MYKLVIFIPPMEDWTTFDEAWPQFLHLAESMPELRRESTSRVDRMLYGDNEVALIHELYFESQQEAQNAMTSPSGRAAGKLLQEMTRGRITLFFADHKEDDLENIRRYKEPPQGDPGA
jgi:uncharacterized protein (TIGR02118 family)